MKMLLIGLAVLSSMSAMSPVLAWGNDCEYSREIKREVSLAESRQLNVVAGAGVLEIKGSDGRDTVLIDATLCAKSESQLADMNVAFELNSDRALIKTEFAINKLWGAGSQGSYIDLMLYVPSNVELDVIDSSGAATVEGVGSLVMVDSSGELAVDGVAGDVSVEDSSGSLEIKRVRGRVLVTDGSGSINVSDIVGDFIVEADGSGSIEAKRVNGNVLVRADGSGSINVSDLGGSFTVGNDSSGGIYHKNVAGKVSLSH